MRRPVRFIFAILFPCILAAQTLEEGIAQFNNRNLAEAKSIFEALLKQDEKNPEAHYRLGLIFLSQRFLDEDQAEDNMERAVELNQNSADYHYGLGAAYGLKAQHASIFKAPFIAPKVKREFEKAIELNPRHLPARRGLAQYYAFAPSIMGGSMDKALEQADEMVALDEVIGRLTKAQFYERDKKLQESENELKTITGHKPGDWRGWKSLGYFYLRNKRTDEAIVQMSRYVELRPDTADSFDSLAEAQLEKGSIDEATKNIEKALGLDSVFISSVYLLGRIHEVKGEKKEAREQYTRLLTMNINENRKKEVEKRLKELQ